MEGGQQAGDTGLFLFFSQSIKCPLETENNPPKTKFFRGALRAPRISFVFPLYFAHLSESLQSPMEMKRFHFSMFREKQTFQDCFNSQWK